MTEPRLPVDTEGTDRVAGLAAADGHWFDGRRARLRRALVLAVPVAYVVAIAYIARRWELPPIGPLAGLALALALLLELAAKGVLGIQFRDALRREGHIVPLPPAISAAFIGTMIARLVPAGSTLSPSAMAWGIRSEDDHAAGAALRVTVTSYGGLLLLAGLAAGAATAIGRWPLSDATAIPVAIFLTLIGLAIVLGSRWLDRAVAWLPRSLRRHFGPTAGRGGITRYQFALIVSRIILEALALWIVLRAFEVHIDLDLALLTYATAKALGGLPLTPGGIGLVEGGMVGLLTAFGLQPETVLAPILAFQIIDYWILAAVGLFMAGRRSRR